MARPEMDNEKQKKIRDMAATMSAVNIAKELGLERRTVARILHPERVKKAKRRYSSRLIRMDKQELSEGSFDVYAVREDWLTG